MELPSRPDRQRHRQGGERLPLEDAPAERSSTHCKPSTPDRPSSANTPSIPGRRPASIGRSIAASPTAKSEILALIAQGKTNTEVAQLTCLSINTIKSYIRSTYRKIGVKSRTQAVLWGVEHGFRPDYRRIDH